MEQGKKWLQKEIAGIGQLLLTEAQRLAEAQSILANISDKDVAYTDIPDEDPLSVSEDESEDEGEEQH